MKHATFPLLLLFEALAFQFNASEVIESSPENY